MWSKTLSIYIERKEDSDFDGRIVNNTSTDNEECLNREATPGCGASHLQGTSSS
jgi:hypothetical protein